MRARIAALRERAKKSKDCWNFFQPDRRRTPHAFNAILDYTTIYTYIYIVYKRVQDSRLKFDDFVKFRLKYSRAHGGGGARERDEIVGSARSRGPRGRGEGVPRSPRSHTPRVATRNYSEDVWLFRYYYKRFETERNRTSRRHTRSLTVGNEPLYDVYHILDFGHIELRIDFVRYFQIWDKRQSRKRIHKNAFWLL